MPLIWLTLFSNFIETDEKSAEDKDKPKEEDKDDKGKESKEVKVI